MRINRFCEARGLYESDNSIESKIFCFGDDGPSGDTSSTAASEDIGTKDVDKGPTSGPNQRDDSGDRQAYSDRFGGTSTRNFNIDTSQNFVDTDQGRVYGSTDVLSAGMASGDISPAGDQATADFTAGLPGPEPSLADFDTTNVPEFDEPAGAVNLEDALGYNPFENFAATPVTQTARGPALGTTDYESGAYGVVGGNIAARGPANIRGTRTGTTDTLSSDIAQENFRARGLDTSDMIPGGVSSPMDNMGVRDVSTTINPMDDLDPFGDGFMTDEERAQSNAIRESSPVEQITRQATDPATSFAAASNLGLTDASTMAAMEDEVAQGLGSLAAAQEPSNFNFSRDVLNVDQGIPQMSLAPESRASQFDRQARMGRVAGPMSMAPVEATRFSGTDMMRQADDVLGQRAFDEAIFGDTSDMPPSSLRVGAEVINSLESTFGGNQARKIADVANRPGGALVRDPQSGEILGAVGPEENIRSAFLGAQDAVYVGDPRGYQQGVEVGTSILGPDTNVRDVGTMDPFTGEFEGRPGADYTNRGPTDTGGGDGGGQIIPPPQEVVPELPPVRIPEEYQGRDIVGGAPGYQPRGPISFAYTGLPSLAPQKLQPSFQARGQYSPLFPMGQIRRRS